MISKQKQKLLEHIFDVCSPTRISRWKGGAYRTSSEEGAALAEQASKEKSVRSELIRAHLGDAPIAVVPTDDSTTSVIVFDIDDKEKSWGTRPVPDASKGRQYYVVGVAMQIIWAARKEGVNGFAVLSGSGYGAHVWFLLKKRIPLSQVDKFARALLKNASSKGHLLQVKNDGGIFAERDGDRHIHNIEVYPKGKSLIALPFARKSEGVAERCAEDGKFEGLVTLDKLTEYEQNEWFEAAMELTALPQGGGRAGSDEDVDWAGAFVAFLRGHAEKKGDLGDYDAWQHAIMVAAASFRDTEHAVWAKQQMITASKAASGWDARAFDKKWSDAVRTVRNITAGSFWHYAKIGGYTGARPGGSPIRDISFPEPKPDCVNPAHAVAKAMGERGYQLDDIRHELNQRFDEDWDEGLLDDIWVNPVPPVLDYDQHVAPMNEDWAQVTEAKSAFIYLKSGDLKAKDGFLDANAHLMLAGPRGGRISVAQEWLKDPHRNYYIGVTVADPETHVNRRGGLLNALKPIPHAAAAGDVEPFLRHLRHLTAMSGHEAYEVLVDFLADMVQRPAATDSQIAVMITGGQGTGKSTLGRLMKAVMGDARYLHLNGNDELFHQYNAFQLGVVLLFCDEVVFAGDAKAQNRLKAMITEADRMTEGKNLPVIRAPNVSRIIAATNNVHALSLEPDDRRWLILNVPRKPDYCLDEFNQWAMRPENAAAILDFLSHRDVDVKRLRAAAPMTAAKREQLVMSDPILAAFIEIAESGVCPHDRYGTGQIATQTLGELVRGNARFPSDREIVQTVRNQWPEVQKRRSKRISRFTGDYKSRDDDTVSVTALWAPGDVSGFSFGDLRRFRAAVSERAGFEISHQDGDAWLCWQPPQQGAVDLRAGTGVDGRGDGEPPF
jgi:Family of unknown function (DUF5906)/TOTE conflict system, Archaeo-Eukaryotic Primase domain